MSQSQSSKFILVHVNTIRHTLKVLCYIVLVFVYYTGS